MDSVDDKVIDKIRKLFALAGSPNEAEAALAMEKAHELLRLHNLQAADIQEKRDVGDKIIYHNTKEEHWKRQLASIVAEANYCAFIVIKNGSAFEYQVFGREENLAATEAMYEYLVIAVRRLAYKAAREHPGLSAVDFKKGVGHRLGERIEAMKAKDVECTALVLVNTEAEQAMRDAHQDIRNFHTRIRSNFSSALGAMMGDTISLNRQVGSKSTTEIR